MLEIVAALAVAMEKDEYRAFSILIVMKLNIGWKTHDALINQPFYAFFRQDHNDSQKQDRRP